MKSKLQLLSNRARPDISENNLVSNLKVVWHLESYFRLC